MQTEPLKKGKDFENLGKRNVSEITDDLMRNKENLIRKTEVIKNSEKSISVLLESTKNEK